MNMEVDTKTSGSVQNKIQKKAATDAPPKTVGRKRKSLMLEASSSKLKDSEVSSPVIKRRLQRLVVDFMFLFYSFKMKIIVSKIDGFFLDHNCKKNLQILKRKNLYKIYQLGRKEKCRS